MHNCPTDCWVSIFDNVYDLTELLASNKGALCEPIIREAGRSVSHWFSQKTWDVKTHVCPERNITMPYTPYGRFIHCPPEDPSDWSTAYDVPWWKDDKYIIGKLTKKLRLVRVVNMLTHKEDVIQTCEEETVADILERYLDYNQHAKSYTFKALKDNKIEPLEMNKTLEENGIKDETETFYELGINDDFYIPVLHIYYNDDLTVA